jgi:hypothetical protein
MYLFCQINYTYFVYFLVYFMCSYLCSFCVCFLFSYSYLIDRLMESYSCSFAKSQLIRAIFLWKIKGVMQGVYNQFIGLIFCSISTNYYRTLLFSIKFNIKDSPKNSLFIFLSISYFLSFYINFYFEIFCRQGSESFRLLTVPQHTPPTNCFFLFSYFTFLLIVSF